MSRVKSLWVEARNPLTGDQIVIAEHMATGRAMYQLNNGPALPIPEGYGQKSYHVIAMMLLRDHAKACEPCDAEEWTLP